MKILGIIVMCIGGIKTLRSLYLVFTQYDMSSTPDIGKASAGLGISVLLIGVGYTVFQKGNKGPDDGVN